MCNTVCQEIRTPPTEAVKLTLFVSFTGLQMYFIQNLNTFVRKAFFPDSSLIWVFPGYIFHVRFSDSMLCLPPLIFRSTPLFYRSNAFTAAVFPAER